MNRKLVYRIVWWYALCCFVVKPAFGQTIPADFRGWFLSQVAGKPFGQQTLLSLEPMLPCVGSALTPPNALGDRTKIWDPQTQHWTRVGFGEGQWVWIAQGDGAPPVVQPCTLPVPAPVPSGSLPQGQPNLDLSAVYARLDSIAAQNERIYVDEVNRLNALSAQLQTHDQKPSGIEAVLTSKTFWASIIGAASSCAATQCWK